MKMKITLGMKIPEFRRIYSLKPVFCGKRGSKMIIESLQGITHVAVFVHPPVASVEVIIYKLKPFIHKNMAFTNLSVLFSVKDKRLWKGKLWRVPSLLIFFRPDPERFQRWEYDRPYRRY